MNGLLYNGNIVPAGEASDGETPTAIYVTQEANGIAIWRNSYEEGLTCIRLDPCANKDRVIEEAVLMVSRERALRKKVA